MADKEVTVKIKPVVDDDSEVKDLESLIKEMDNTHVHIPVETEASSWYDLQAKIEELENEKILINMGVLDGDVDEVQSKIDDLKQQQIDLTVNTDDSSVDDAGDKVDDLDGSTPGVTVDTDDSSVDDAEDKVDNLDGKEVTVNVGADTSSAEESISGLEEALTAVGAGAALAGMEQMVSTASNIQDSWNRLGLTFGEVTGQMQTDISEAVEHTGRSGALTRQYFNDMGIAGVTNSELLQQSFEALSGRAYQTGNSIESMEQKMKMIVMSGNAGARQLTQLGITTADLGRVMGVTGEEASKMFKSLSQEERLRVLTQAMGDGKQANDMYKNSWQGLKEQVDKATAGLMGAVGSAILPVLIPVMKAAADVITFLATAFGKLPEPIRAGIGIVLSFVMGFLAITTVISVLRTLESTLKLVTTAQEILNFVAAMNPYVLIAVAVIALIAALWYLYNTNEAVKQAFDHVGQALGQLWDKLTTALKPAIDAIINAWNSLMEALGIGGGDIFDGIIFFIVAFAEGLVLIINGITEFIGWLQQLWMAADQLINGTDWLGWLQVLGLVFMGPIGWIVLLIQHWNQIAPAVSGALSAMYQNAVTWFNQTGARIHSFASDLVSTIGSAAWNAVSSFAAGIIGITSAIAGELDRAWSTVVSWGQQLIQRFWQIAVDAVNALKKGLGIGSPGFMYYMVEGELNRIDDLAKYTDMPSSFGTLANNMVNNFNPQFSNGSSSAGAGGVVNNFNFTFTDFIDDKQRLIDLIIRTITDEINWDNDRANRTV